MWVLLSGVERTFDALTQQQAQKRAHPAMRP
jgi:hypothetical protein